MLAGLSALELGRLRMSVGYGTHKKGRPLSPIEVGSHLRRARADGVSLSDCAIAVDLNGTGHIGRFLRILDLPQDLQHLVDWGAGKGFIGFSLAVELTRISGPDDQRVVAKAILEDRLSSKEVRQVGQLRNRSGKHIGDCIKEVVGMRPTFDRRYVFIGSVADEEVEQALARLSQANRDAVLKLGLQILGLKGATGRLGNRFFTLVGDEGFDAFVKKIGKESVEARLRTHIAGTVADGAYGC